MKKEEISVLIDSEEKRLKALHILENANESIYKDSLMFQKFTQSFKLYYVHGKWLVYPSYCSKRTDITFEQLEQLLSPKEVGMTVNLGVEELRLQAEKLGFELTEKKREIKVGDFGVFWDDIREECSYGFLIEKKPTGFKDKFHVAAWDNFCHLTDEEKSRIQKNW